jgi:hypothetical protein
MSYELVFWRQEAMMPMSSREIYELLRAGGRIDGLSNLSVDDFAERVLEMFPDAVRGSSEAAPWIEWRGPNGEDSFRMTWTDQHVQVDCRHVALNDVNTLVDIAKSFGCPLYDPQTGERFRLTSP